MLKGIADGIPDELDALLFTSDLQGTVQENGETRLLGEVLPEFLADVLAIELNLCPEKTGVLLCGDFFALPGRRGGLGDVTPIWQAFKKQFRWVAGVSGNHDDFGQNQNKLNRLRQEPGMFYLENNRVEIDRLDVAGFPA